jgi:hypothetical protein
MGGGNYKLQVFVYIRKSELRTSRLNKECSRRGLSFEEQTGIGSLVANVSKMSD